MKPIYSVTVGLCLLGSAFAQVPFNSGSTGADGALNVTEDLVLDLPPSGVLNYTTISIAGGKTLRFNRNVLNTPVYLLASGDVEILGAIDISGGNRRGSGAGLGGPGGFDGGFGAFEGFPSGDGQGPGGGKASPNRVEGSWGGVYSVPVLNNTNIYGNTLLSPLIGGSGGSASGYNNTGGGGGGGAVLIASSSRITINGSIVSKGGVGAGGGSGGAIRVVAPVVSGEGILIVSGGLSDDISYNNGGAGRTRIDSLDRFAHRSLTTFWEIGKPGSQVGKRGSQMFVFPPGNPRLDIINAAGSAIAEGTVAPVTVTLAAGASPEQMIRVQARGFTTDIPIRIRVTPENAPSATFDGTILLASGNPPFADVNVTIPADTVCHVHAWSR